MSLWPAWANQSSLILLATVIIQEWASGLQGQSGDFVETFVNPELVRTLSLSSLVFKSKVACSHGFGLGGGKAKL